MKPDILGGHSIAGKKEAEMTGRSIARVCVCTFLVSLLDFGWGPESAGLASPAGPESRIGQPAGVEIVSNPKTPPPPPGHRKKLVFTPELSIGESGSDNEVFGARIDVNTDGDGNVYVTDFDARRILKFSPEGRYLLDIGRQGQGPGEFLNPSQVRFDEDGNPYVTDMMSRRISFFDPSGTYLRQIGLPEACGDLCVLPSGRFIATRSVRLDDMGFSQSVVCGIFDDAFELITEFGLREYSVNPPSSYDATSVFKTLGSILGALAFRPRPSYGLGQALVYFGGAEDYAIDVFSLDGRKIRTIRREFEPLPITAKDKDRFIRRTAEPYLAHNNVFRTFSASQRKEIYGSIDYPEHKPAYQGFCLLENGWLLVTADVVPGGLSLFDLFDETGRYIGQFESDFPGDTPHFFKNGKAYAVFEGDEFTSVRRYAFEVREY